MTRASRTTWLAYGICALLTAACGDRLVEAFQNAGIFGATVIDADHQGIMPILACATLLISTLGIAIARDCLRARGERAADWRLQLARDLSRATAGGRFATIVSAALVFVAASESYERGFGGALPFDLAHASVGDALGSLSLYLFCAMLVTLAVGCFVRALVWIGEAIATIVTALAALFERDRDDASARGSRANASVFSRTFLRLSGTFADRAPPNPA